MPYIAFIIICISLHVLINIDMFVKKDNMAAIKPYRAFAVSVLLFYISDALWGGFNDYHLGNALYISTFAYFALLGTTILLWTDFVVRFIEGNHKFAVWLKIIGLLFFLAEITLLIVNFFTPILYVVDANATYITYIGRDAMLYAQLGMYSIVTIYSFFYSIVKKSQHYRRYIAITMFSIVMITFISIQLGFPELPLYSAGCLIGGCLLDTFALSDTKERFKKAYQRTSAANEEHIEKLTEATTLANTDSLTGVGSRHAYVEVEQHLDDLIDKRTCPEFAVAVFDLNGLKKINDTYGHDAGDEYIKDAVKIICSCFPEESVYRFGGDEFVAILEGEAFETRQKRMDNFTRIIDSNIGKNHAPIVAAGLSKYRPNSDNTFRAVFNRADKTMFVAKDNLKERQNQ